MAWYARGLLRLTAATVLAVAGLAVAFVVAPAQDSTGVVSEQSLTTD
jgi:hypothetical protein